MEEVRPKIVSNLSLAVCLLIARCDGIEISRSTGFLWSHEQDVFLITNWHCVTGVNPQTGRSLSKTGARPTSVSVALTTSQFGVKLHLELPLYDVDGNARWLVHPTAGEQVDIVAIGMTKEIKESDAFKRTLARPMNEFESKHLEAFVGDELMIVGFPRNLHIHGLPIFKRAPSSMICLPRR